MEAALQIIAATCRPRTMANSSSNSTGVPGPWSIPCDGDMAPGKCDLLSNGGGVWQQYHLIMTGLAVAMLLDYVVLSLYLDLPRKLFKKELSWKNFKVSQRIFVCTGICFFFTVIRHLGSYFEVWVVSKIAVFVMVCTCGIAFCLLALLSCVLTPPPPPPPRPLPPSSCLEIGSTHAS